MQKSPRSRRVTRRLLDSFPIPAPGSNDDKEERGRVLVVGGERTLPGAIVLAGIAALRAGAGKLQLATVESVSIHAGIAVPEALALGLTETEDGAIAPEAIGSIAEYVTNADAILIGPGMSEKGSNTEVAAAVCGTGGAAAVILDAGALSSLAEKPRLLNERAAVITPHVKEMATMLNLTAGHVAAHSGEVALDAARTFGATVVLKGPATSIATPDGELFTYQRGDVGLATSGSGDTLAGIAAGLLARGADTPAAAIWSVYVHGEAGNLLVRKIGRVGYLAREILEAIPRLLERSAAR